MKIAVLASNRKSFSVQRLYQAFKGRGHDVEIIDPHLCFMDISGNRPMVYYKKRRLDGIDAVIPRVPSSIGFYGMAIVRQFQMMGIYCLNTADAIGNARDKLKSLQLLSRYKIPMPLTSFANSTKQTQRLIDLVGGAPTIVKLLEGAQGRGVVLAETQKASESLIDAFRELKANFLVQEFVKEANGCDIRCFVIGDKVVASMQRVAKPGEYRSNIHRGGTGEIVEITQEENDIAIACAKAIKLQVAGIDIIRSASGPKVLEVNSSPGLEGIEGTTKLNIADMIVEFVENEAQRFVKAS